MMQQTRPETYIVYVDVASLATRFPHPFLTWRGPGDFVDRGEER